MQLDGKIIAPTSSQPWGSGLLQWLDFINLKGFTIKGKGIIDGQGSVWWGDSVSLYIICQVKQTRPLLFLLLNSNTHI